MAEIYRSGLVRVHFTAEQKPGQQSNGHPYPNVEWMIDGGVLFMRLAEVRRTREKPWDFIFSPSKWSHIEPSDGIEPGDN